MIPVERTVDSSQELVTQVPEVLEPAFVMTAATAPRSIDVERHTPRGATS